MTILIAGFHTARPKYIGLESLESSKIKVTGSVALAGCDVKFARGF